MSRLIVKNLPKNVTDEKLKTLFSKKGVITDVQLKYTPDGKFRQFAFIGYQTPEEAQKALNFFHNTYISTNRITVDWCANLGDDKVKPWSKHSKRAEKSSEEKEKKKPVEADEGTSVNDLVAAHKDDPLFQEYLEIHSKEKGLWKNDILFKASSEDKTEDKPPHIDSGNDSNDDKNDDDNEDEEEEEEDDEESDGNEKLANEQISDLEYMKSLMNKNAEIGEEVVTKKRQRTEKKVREKIDLFTVKVRGLPYKCKKKDLKHFFHPLVPYSIRLPRQVKGFAYIGFKKEKDMNKAVIKDRSFLLGKQVSVVKFDSQKPESNSNDNPKFKKWKNQEESLKNEEDIAISGKIFVRNLSYMTTEDDIQNLFEKFGPITEVNLPIDKNTRQIKGFGTISFLMPEHAAKAYCDLDGSVFNGRMLHLLPAKAVADLEQENEEMSFKEKKLLEQKKQASSSHNWNSLFVSADAVANTVAETYGSTKERVLGTELASRSGTGTSAAVRLALGETQIVNDVKTFLEKRGVCLDVFNSLKVKRSKSVILVKNLPSFTTENEIAAVFKPFGVLGRVILPPNGITAVVEFLEAAEARNAFKKLAYSKFKTVPLYLEWAPEHTFKTEFIGSNKTDDNEKKIKSSEEKSTNDEKQKDNENPISEDTQEENIDEEIEPEENTVLFVKNINFSTTNDTLRRHFEKCGKLSYANVAVKKNPQHPGQTLSMGYGFVRYMRQHDAEKALKELQFSELDGKTLELKRSERTSQNDVKTSRKPTAKKNVKDGTKILIRNIPFQANIREIRDLFVTFGEIKALRLPKKMSLDNTSHRGFAFVDFHTKSDAKRAFEALSQSTHLYGRRLVLEWAENETEDLTELRKRTADHLQTKHVHNAKKSVLDLDKN